MPGLGVAVTIDHGNGFRTLTARLKAVEVQPGSTVEAGAAVGEAAALTVHLQLTQDGAWLDPLPWLRR